MGQKRAVATICTQGRGGEEGRRGGDLTAGEWGSSGKIQGSLTALRSATEVRFPALHHFRLSNRALRGNAHSLPRTATRTTT